MIEFYAMKNITLSADAELIERARARARARQTTLNEEFRRWLMAYASEADRAEAAEQALSTVREIRQRVNVAGRKFTREEMNER
ncbi:MAG: hypothetical protein O2798_03345 [Chloroflexi bacterium]|nr:hypothetical protein [Chloroflexota bacterium]MDA1239859.1 hypothetical protein [Chloroflexota bacterium]